MINTIPKPLPDADARSLTEALKHPGYKVLKRVIIASGADAHVRVSKLLCDTSDSAGLPHEQKEAMEDVRFFQRLYNFLSDIETGKVKPAYVTITPEALTQNPES